MTKRNQSDKTQIKGKRGGRRSTTWVKGIPSPNPKGAPKRGESWKEIIDTVSKLTAEQIRQSVGNNDLGRAFQQMPKGIPMRDLVVMRVFSALMFEPQSGLWNTLIERVEGKVPQPVQFDVTEELRRLMRDLNLSPTDIASDPALAALFGVVGVALTDSGTDSTERDNG